MIRNLRRMLQVTLALWRYLILPAIPPWRRNAMSGPRRLRLFFESLGGVWVKMGQNLALRFDLLPPDYCNELYKLMNEVRPFPYEQAREIIRRELGAYPEELFASFEPEPFGAASIGQVHRAVLPSGQPVAVKVQRPNIRKLIRIDVNLMYLTANFMDITGLSGETSSRDVIDEFVRWLTEELDYLIEARNARIMSQNAADDPIECNARVFTDYTTSRVLTTELVDGIPMIDIVYAIRGQNSAYLANLKARGYDLDTVVRHLDWNLLNQMYVYGYFHADLHPANLFVLPNNAIGYIDFGIVGKLSDGMRESMMQYSWHLYQNDPTRSTEEILRWVIPSARTDLEAAQQDLLRVHEDYLFTLHDAADHKLRYATVNLGTELLNLIRKHRMALHPGAVAYFKTVFAADALRYELSPAYDLESLVNRFFGRMIRQSTRELLAPGYASQQAFEYSLRLRRLLRSYEQQERDVGVVKTRAMRLWRRLQVLGLLAIAVALGLYIILAFPALRSPGGTITTTGWTPLVLLAALVLLIITIIFASQRLAEDEREVGQAEGPRRPPPPRRTIR